MLGKVLMALGAALYIGTIVVLFLWGVAETGLTSAELFADWRYITGVAMCVAGWVFAHSMQLLLVEESKESKEQSE